MNTYITLMGPARRCPSRSIDRRARRIVGLYLHAQCDSRQSSSAVEAQTPLVRLAVGLLYNYSCKTNPQQIELMEFEPCPTCVCRWPVAPGASKHQNTRCPRLYHSPTVGVHGEMFKSRVWDKVPEGSAIIFGDTLISLQNSVAQIEGSLYAKEIISSIRAAVSTQCWRVTDKHTHRQTHDGS